MHEERQDCCAIWQGRRARLVFKAMERLLTSIIRFGDRHERTITIIAGAWFVISCASWIPFLPIPKIPYLTDNNSWMLSGAWNAIWWGGVHPLLENHRKRLDTLEPPADPTD